VRREDVSVVEALISKCRLRILYLVIFIAREENKEIKERRKRRV
jgi:hypothetical protein